MRKPLSEFMTTFKTYLKESSTGTIYQPTRGEALNFNPKDHPEIYPELFNLIQKAYAEVGGHLNFRTPADIANSDENWVGADVHETPDFDVILFGKDTPSGTKLTGAGNDGSKPAKNFQMQLMTQKLNSDSFAEVSGKIAEILINKYHTPVIQDEATVRKILRKPIKWIGDGWYEREIGGKLVRKILVGTPSS